ncbi:MAG: redoxin domain-containing protein [Myxococcota bacterium]
MATPDSEASSSVPSSASAASGARPPRRRLDALGIVAFVLYIAVGGVLVFGFGQSLESAVRTQNETACRAMQPAHAQVTGRVLDVDGQPIEGTVVVPVIDGRGGAPVEVDAKEGRFQLFLPRGDQALRVRAPGKEGIEASFVLGDSEILDVEITLVAEGQDGSALQEVRRSPYEAPPFVVQDLEGREVALSEFRGKLVVLNFWATWCEPCITEWPQVAKLSERLADNGDVVVLAVSIDEERDNIGPFLAQMSLDDTDVRVLWDPSTKLHEQLGSSKIPDTYFVDEQGQVHSVFVNTREWGSPGALRCVESSLGR